MKNLFKIYLIIFFAFLMIGCNNSNEPTKNPAKIVISKFVITNDDNSNDKANPGETISISVYLKNTGDIDAKNVFINEIKSLSDFITIGAISVQTDLEFGDILAGQEKTDKYSGNNYSLKILLNQATTIDSNYLIVIKVQDYYGTSWNDTLNIFVEKTNANLIISNFVIVGDNNNNGKANPGEDLQLAIYLKNTGTDKANNVFIKEIKSLSDFITIGAISVQSDLEFGDILAGQEKTDNYSGNNYSFKISLNQATAIDSNYLIVIKVQDYNGTSWNDTLNILVEKTNANLIISKFVIVGDNNNNGKANPGEDLQFALYLKNIGTDKANNVFIKEIKSLSDFITIGAISVQSDLEFGDILSGQEKTDNYSGNNYSFKASVKSTTQVGEKLQIRLTIQDKEGNNWQSEFETIIE